MKLRHWSRWVWELISGEMHDEKGLDCILCGRFVTWPTVDPKKPWGTWVYSHPLTGEPRSATVHIKCIRENTARNSK